MATLTGTANDDMISTWPARDLDDTLYGLGGNDTLYGIGGNDLYYGGDGDDSLQGYSGNDTMHGDAGNDSITGDYGIDSLYGGDGDDVLRLGAYGGGSGGAIYGGSGRDFLSAAPAAGVTLDGGADIDTIYLTSPFFFGGVGDLVIDFSGPEKLVRSTSGDMILIDVEAVSAFLGDGQHSITGGSFNDAITLYTGVGASLIDLGAGNDSVWVYDDDVHTIEGGSGIDMLRIDHYGPGRLDLAVDAATGAISHSGSAIVTGFETFMIVVNTAADLVLGAGADSVYGGTGAITVDGAGGADQLTLGTAGDSAWGGAGDDSLRGARGHDQLFGGSDHDLVTGGAGNDSLQGDDGNDRLQSGQGDDLIFGGAGNDTLLGQAIGNDTMTGGSGADRFINSGAQWGNHLITDFESGVDRIHLSGAALDADLHKGFLADDEIAYGAADQPHAQFVLIYDSAADETALVYDDNGTTNGGGYTAVMRFEGNVTLDAQDIYIL